MSIPIIDILQPLGNFPVATAEHIGVNGESLDTVLNTKADTSSVSAKADKTYVDSQLAGKANNSDVTALQTAVNNKVEQIPGKSLSSNDYTNAEKSKVSSTAEEVARLASYFTVIS